MSRDTNSLLPLSLREEVKRRKWTPGNLVDLHKMGIHWHDDKFMPVALDPLTYAAYFRSGLTSPISLPTFFPDDTRDKIKKFLEFNYFKLAHGGAQYLGNEFNIMPEEKFETSKLRVCILRLSTYADIDGAFGHYLISNFVEDYSDDIFVDFAFRPDDSDYSKIMDADLPLLWANTTKRPLQDFDMCFTPDTAVLTKDGWVAISEIVEGDQVLTYNESTKDREYKQVIATSTHLTSKPLLDLEFEKEDGEVVRVTCTNDHKFLTKNRGWVEAQHLEESDELIDS